MLKWLLQRLLILIALVVASVTLPLASFWICKYPAGAAITFLVGPWTVAFWVLLLPPVIRSHWWEGRATYQAWRARQGGFFRYHFWATSRMFGSLIASYAAEGALIHYSSSPPVARQVLPFVTYSPVALCVLWSAIRG